MGSFSSFILNINCLKRPISGIWLASEAENYFRKLKTWEDHFFHTRCADIPCTWHSDGPWQAILDSQFKINDGFNYSQSNNKLLSGIQHSGLQLGTQIKLNCKIFKILTGKVFQVSDSVDCTKNWSQSHILRRSSVACCTGQRLD